MLTDAEFEEGIKPCTERHEPNPETVEAMESARRGEVTSVNSVEELFIELNITDRSKPIQK